MQHHPHSPQRRSLEEIFLSFQSPTKSPEEVAASFGQLYPEMNTRRKVLTGPQSSGKTTSKDFLAALGIDTLHEAARHVLSAASKAGYSTGEIFDPNLMIARQQAILHAGLNLELPIHPDRPLVMDRSCLDVIPFSEALGMDVSEWHRLAEIIRYEQIIYLEPLPLVGDAEREADEKAEKLRIKVDELSRSFWTAHGYQVTYVPAVDADGKILSFGTRLGLVAKALGMRGDSIWTYR